MTLKDSKTVIHAVVSQQLASEIKRIAEENHTSMSKVISDILGTFILSDVGTVVPETFSAVNSGMAKAILKTLNSE